MLRYSPVILEIPHVVTGKISTIHLLQIGHMSVPEASTF
jgi:hypothetical protein